MCYNRVWWKDKYVWKTAKDDMETLQLAREKVYKEEDTSASKGSPGRFTKKASIQLAEA